MFLIGGIIKKGFALMLAIMILVTLSIMSSFVLLNIMETKSAYIKTYNNTKLSQIAEVALNEVLYRMNKHPNDYWYIGDNAIIPDTSWKTIILFKNINYRKEHIIYTKSILTEIENFDKESIEFNYTTKEYIPNKSLTIQYKFIDDQILLYSSTSQNSELFSPVYSSIYSPIIEVKIFVKNKMFAKHFTAEIYNASENLNLPAVLICKNIKIKDVNNVYICGYENKYDTDYNTIPDSNYCSSLINNLLNSNQYPKHIKAHIYEENTMKTGISGIGLYRQIDIANTNIFGIPSNTLINKIPSLEELIGHDFQETDFKTFDMYSTDTLEYYFYSINTDSIYLNFDTYSKGLIYSNHNITIDGDQSIYHKGLMYIDGDLIINSNTKLWILGALIVNGKIICNGELHVLYSPHLISSSKLKPNYRLLKWD